MTSTILHGNCLDVLKTLPDNSIHMAVTSPPYWGLRAYGTEGQTWPDGWIGELGHEPTPQLYVAHLVQIMREVRRVLRDDGTLWLNLGDSYATGTTADRKDGTLNLGNGTNQSRKINRVGTPDGLKTKDLVGIPWRVAFALQDDGWWLRQDIIWAKPNPMPESVTDRCTKAHEYMFLLAKSARYYYDAEAVKEPSADTGGNGTFNGRQGNARNTLISGGVGTDKQTPYGAGRNRRSVWTITTKPFREAHFATFPPDLVEPCIKAGTSQRGVCSTCGAPWERVVERGLTAHDGETKTLYAEGTTASRLAMLRQAARQRGAEYSNSAITTDWRPNCTCNADAIPATVLDPFNGAGTTGVVAKSLGREYIGIELNPAYVEMAQRRIAATASPLFVSEAA